MKLIKFTVWSGLSLRIIALFFTAMLVSFSPALFRDFFDDSLWPEDDGRWHSHGLNAIDEKWDWGYRHYLYFFMCIALFIVQAVRLIKWINKNEDSFKP